MHYAWLTVLCNSYHFHATFFRFQAASNFRDEQIDIDDVDIEGSGGGTEVSDDLVSSGSGYGPDDEDSTSKKRC